MSLQVVIFVGAMLWTNLTDRLGKPKGILMVAILGYTVFFSLLALPVFTRPEQVAERLIFTSSVLSFTWVFSSCFFPIVDSTILAMLEKAPNFTKDHYNNQRMWGVPAHVVAGFVSGKAMRLYGTIGYQAVVFISTLCFAVMAFWTMPSKIDFNKDMKTADVEKVESVQVKETPINPTWKLLTNWDFMFFAMVGLSAGILRSSLTNFQAYHMEKSYKMPTEKTSYTAIPRIGSEIAIYMFGKKLSKKIGNYWMLILSQVAGLFRVFGYAFAPVDGNWQYFPYVLEASKGLNSGLFVASSVRIASDIAPPGCATSAQGLFSGTYAGLAMFVGGIISGSLLYYADNDLHFMFAWIGYISLLFTVIFVVRYGFFDRRLHLPCCSKS